MGISPSTARKIITKSDFLVRPFKEKGVGDYLGYARAGESDFPMVQALPPDFDPDNLPEGWETRTDQVRDSQGKVHDVVRYLSPRTGRDFTYLRPFAEGSGWRTSRGAPDDPRFDGTFDGMDYDQDEIDEFIESYNERLKDFEGEAIPDIIDTADHETGHVATQDELYSKYFTQDPTSIFQGLSSDEKSRVMARMLDDPKFARAKMREPRQPFPNRFSDKSTRSAWHEKAAYTTEFPFNPEYAAAKWLHHRDVEQAERRAYLEAVARAQKKWGIENPINAQRMAKDLNPKRKGGRRPSELRRIMGMPPERKPGMPLLGEMSESDWQPVRNPDAERLLLPPQERIYRNLRNAILQQGAGILDESGAYATDPTGMTPSTYYDENTGPRRKKMAEEFTSEAMSALDNHFKDVLAGNAPVPKTIADLPDNVKGELGRLQLRRILAGQVGDQTRLTGDDRDWKDPDYGYIQDWRPMNMRYYPMSFDLWDKNMGVYGDSPLKPELRRLAELGLIEKPPGFRTEYDKDNPYYKLYSKWANMRDEYLDSMDSKSELSYHHFNPAMIAAIREDYNDGYPWKWDKDYKKPGPKEQAVIDDITQKRAAIQQELIDYAKELGIEDDIMNLNRPKVFPDMMRSDMEFVEFDPENNPEHKEVLDAYNEYYMGRGRYNNERFPQKTPYDLQTIYNLFPSLQYGLIPKEALELKENYDGRNLKYKLPTMKRTYKGKEWDIEEDGLPHQTRTGRYDDKEMSEYDLTGELTNLYDRISSYERDRYEPIEEQLIPHPLAGKPMSALRNVGLESADRWKLLSEKGDAFKRNRRDYAESDYTDMRANVNRFDDLDIVSYISEMAEKEGIPFNEAYNKYYIEGHDDYYTGSEDGGLFFGLKSKKPRYQPQKAGAERRHKYDPVSRAIAQAFMDSEYDREVWTPEEDEETFDGRKPTDEMTEKEREMFPAFGGEPHDSEFKRRASRVSDDWDLDSYVQQLENPASDDPNTRYQRKTLTEILSEIADRRLEEAGFDSWYQLDRELKRRKEEEELEDED